MKKGRKKPGVLRVKLSADEVRILRDEKRRQEHLLRERAGKLLNTLIDLELLMEEFERDPERRAEYEKEHARIKEEYEKTLRDLEAVEKGGLPLSNPVFQEVLSGKIGSEFVKSKEEAEEQLRMILYNYRAMISDLQEDLATASGRRRMLILGQIDYLRKRVREIEEAVRAEKRRKKSAD